MKLTKLLLLPLAVAFADEEPAVAFPGTLTSSGSGRLDLFITDRGKNVYHKYYANSKAGWSIGYDPMNINSADSDPVAVNLGKDQVHAFIIKDSSLHHTFWDGTQWLPEYGSWELLAQKVSPSGQPAVTARGSNRLHIVTKGLNRNYVHKYYDGSSWQPSGNETTEDLGRDGLGDVDFESDPVINSWGSDRLDIFGTLTNGTLVHKFWDGYQWQPSYKGWESWGDGPFKYPTVTSWGENRLDVWASAKDKTLAHRWWDGYSLSNWESLGGQIDGKPQITHWSSNRIDIVVTANKSIVHKYWDGYQWNPSDAKASWNNHGPKDLDPITQPVTASAGNNNLNIIYGDEEGKIRWQYWNGKEWKPSYDAFYDIDGSYEFDRGSIKQAKTLHQEKMPNFKPNLKDSGKGAGILVKQDGESLDL